MRLISVFCALGLLLGLAGSTTAADLQQILERHAEALGGRAKIESIRSLLIEAEISMGGMTGVSNAYYDAPDRARVELSLPLMSYTQLCDGQECWLIDGQGLVTKLTAEFKGMLVTQEALERHHYLDQDDFDGEMSLADSLIAIDSFACFQIDLLPNEGVPAQIFIDSSDYLIRQIAIETDMARVLSRPSDYRKIDGMMMPFRTVESTDAGFVAGEITVTHLEINPELPDSLFVLPQQKPGAQSQFADSLVVPFELLDNHIYVEVQIAGSGPYSFIFDSGAGGTALGLRAAAELGLESLGQAEARGVGGADSAQVFVIPELQFGGLRLDSLTAFALDLSTLEAMLDHPLAGIIGYDLLSRFTITVDYENSQLLFYDAATEPRDSWGESCELSLDFRLPYMEMLVNDSISGLVRIDTGARSTIDLNSPFTREHNLLDTISQEYLLYDVYGLGGSSHGAIAMLPALTICGARLDSVFAGFSLSTEGLFAGTTAAGNLGNGILKRFVVTFDYAGSRIYFKKRAAAEKLGRIRNMAGVGIADQKGYFTVVEVLEGCPAVGKLEVGDRILHLDGRPLTGLSVSQVNWLLIDEIGKLVEIEIERQGEKLTKRIVLQSLY